MLYTKFNLKAFLLLKKKSFKCFFLSYMGMAAVLLNDAEPFEQCQHPFDRRPHVKSGKKWSSGFREEDS